MMLLQNVDESFVNVKESAGILEVELVSTSQLQSTEHGESATMHLPRITEQQVNDDWCLNAVLLCLQVLDACSSIPCLLLS